MEFFEIQTRFNAMKAYIKYLSEFENIFDKLKLDEEAMKAKKDLIRKGNINKSTYMPFSYDIVSGDTNTSIVKIIKIII
jgi:hypothetical protein